MMGQIRGAAGMRVLLADNHVQVRWALRTYLREELGLVILDEVTDAQGLLIGAKACCPSLILVEWDLPGQPIREVLPSLRELNPSVQIVVLSRRSECRLAALAAGANAFVCKAGPPGQLSAALRELLGGGKPSSGNGAHLMREGENP
jgi:two-component system, NarL family, nitrate/nitrite response regulator NarL